MALDSKWQNIAYIPIVKPSPFPLAPNMIAPQTSFKNSSWSAHFLTCAQASSGNVLAGFGQNHAREHSKKFWS